MFSPIDFAEMSDIQEIALAAAASPEYMAKALKELFGVGVETDGRETRPSDPELSVAEAV
jgi:hypothetical protein